MRWFISIRYFLSHKRQSLVCIAGAKLPKTSFKASDVRVLAPGIAAGTLSQRLTGWVNEKKLKRTGTRRGTRYIRAS